jgi:hypothetical protein
MPKELHEITKFMTGTITTPSETDVPDDTASYSLNIDPVAEDGVLKGVPNDAQLSSGGIISTNIDASGIDKDLTEPIKFIPYIP